MPAPGFSGNDNKLTMVSGRTMDWPESTEPKLVVFPRGLQRDGGRIATETIVKDNPAKWTSKYGSLATSLERGVGSGLFRHGDAAADGFRPRQPGMGFAHFAQTFRHIGREGRGFLGHHIDMQGQVL